jgi:hypothetical protein
MNLLKKMIQKIIKKSVTAEVEEVVPEVEPIEPVVPVTNSKKALWKFIIQTIMNILAAVLTALGASAAVIS